MGFLQALADVILICAAFASLIAFAMLGFAGWYIYRISKEIKGEVTQVADVAKSSVREVADTGKFVSESIVKPASTVAGYGAAIKATAKALTEEITRKEKRS